MRTATVVLSGMDNAGLAMHELRDGGRASQVLPFGVCMGRVHRGAKITLLCDDCIVGVNSDDGLSKLRFAK